MDIGDPIGTIVDVFPYLRAGFRIEAEHSFIARHHRKSSFAGFAFGGRPLLAVDKIETTADDSRAAIAAIDVRAPDDGRSTSRQSLDNPGFAPDAIPLGTHPLWPIISGGNWAED